MMICVEQNAETRKMFVCVDELAFVETLSRKSASRIPHCAAKFQFHFSFCVSFVLRNILPV